MKCLTYILIALLFASCSQSKERSEHGSEKALSTDEAHELRVSFLKQTISEELNKSELSIHKKFKDFYKLSDQSYIWSNADSLNEAAIEMIAILDSSWGFGLPKNYQQSLLLAISDSLEKEITNKTRQHLLAEAEILLSYNSLQFVADLKYGIVNTDSMYLEDRIDSLNEADIKQFYTSIQKNSINAAINHTFAPQFVIAKDIISGLKEYVSSYELSDHTFTLPNYKQDSNKAYSVAKEALILHGFSDSTVLTVDSVFVSELKRFQLWHGLEDDYKIGGNTQKAIAMSNLDRYLMAVATLEKWKNTSFDDHRYLFVNVPSYTLRYVRNDSIIKQHRVVVGAPTTRTPSFSAKLKYLNVNPRWHVPYSISSKELLPSIKRDSTYLKRHGYRVYTSDYQAVDASNVDWSSVSQNSFNYRIVQNSGAYNSLGIIAFMFPNEHSVFIHDTPSKFFFTQSVRAYSHGCVRLQDPVELAKYILAEDVGNEYSADSIDTMLVKRAERRIYLKDQVEVYIDYFTTESRDGKLVFFPDVYGRDDKMRLNLKKFIKESQDQNQTL